MSILHRDACVLFTHKYPHTDIQTRSSDQIWKFGIRRPIILIIFPLHYSPLLVFLLSILAVFAFVSILVSAFHNTKLLQSSARGGIVCACECVCLHRLKNPGCFISILKHVARVPCLGNSGRWVMMVRVSCYYILLENPKKQHLNLQGHSVQLLPCNSSD